MENIMNELENLLKDLYKISGLNMSIFDLNQNLLASYPHKKSKFCNELEKNNNAFQHWKFNWLFNDGTGRYRNI